MHGADGAAGTGPVVHHHGLAQSLAQLLGIQARHGIGIAAGRIGHDDGDGLARIGLRQRGTGHLGCSQQCSSDNYLATNVFHEIARGVVVKPLASQRIWRIRSHQRHRARA
ncbi:hypothetical protein SDC9_181911 [bioreactor metagenome]|uniref:Uncharacterized protein n=1 Tax=bioreactor metagenome TaxID=1076179 RepID=A0A645H5Z6_9ZZZZ